MNEVTIEVLHNYYEMSKNLSSNDKIKLKEMLHITESDEKRLVGLKNGLCETFSVKVLWKVLLWYNKYH